MARIAITGVTATKSNIMPSLNPLSHGERVRVRG
jgi:hypothetical protein